jgi:hypothetical protein
MTTQPASQKGGLIRLSMNLMPNPENSAQYAYSLDPIVHEPISKEAFCGQWCISTIIGKTNC